MRREGGEEAGGDQGAEMERMFLLEKIFQRHLILSIPLLLGGHSDLMVEREKRSFVVGPSWVTILTPSLLVWVALNKVLSPSRPK